MTRICYITPNSPLPADRGGRVRAHQLWRALGACGEVKVFVLGDTPPRREREMIWGGAGVLLPRRRLKLARFSGPAGFQEGIDPPGLWEVGAQLAAWSGNERFWHGLSSADAFHRHHLNERRIARLRAKVAAFRPDVVVLCDTGMAPLLPSMKSLGCKVVVGPHNLDSELYRTIGEHAPDPAYARWADLLRRQFLFMERSYFALADQVWACSHIDAQRLRDNLGLADVRLVPNAIDVMSPAPRAIGRDLVYIAQMGYRPNEEAALSLIDMSRRFDARGVPHTLHLVGRSTERIRQAAQGAANVRVVGPVPSTAPYLAMAAVIPVPLRVGGGTRIKIVEAMAAGKPVVSTAIGIEGIEATSGEHCIITDDVDAFDDAVLHLLDYPDEAERIGLAGYALAAQHYSSTALVDLVKDAFGALGLPVPAASPRPPSARVVAKTARFNALTRLLVLRLMVAADRPLDALDVELRGHADPEVCNSGTSLSWSQVAGRPVQVAEVTAVLPGNVAIADLVVLGYAYGEEILRDSGAGATIVEERAGLITAAVRTDEALDGLAWLVQDGHSTCQVTFDARHEASARSAMALPMQPGLEITHFTVPTGGPLTKVKRLVVQPASVGAGPEGSGQEFWAIPAFSAAKSASSTRLLALRNVHIGRTAWLIGNGPSVRSEDLDRLQGCITFAFNRFHLAHAQTRLRPTYTVTGDRQMIEDFGQDIVDQSGGTVFVADDQPPALVGDFVWLRQIPVYPPLFSKVPAEWVSPGGSSLYVAMQLAYFMGIRRFYVYGADFKFVYQRARNADKFRVATGDDNHFIKNYRNNKPWCPPSFRDICPAFLSARLLMELEGGWIRNVTRGGLLEIFERAEFESGFQTEGETPTHTTCHESS